MRPERPRAETQDCMLISMRLRGGAAVCETARRTYSVHNTPGPRILDHSATNPIRREPLKHDIERRHYQLWRPGMTVCTTSMFVWRYGPEDLGTALVAASDKMLTDEGLGIEYQGSRGKWAAFGRRLLGLVAGEMAIHS